MASPYKKCKTDDAAKRHNIDLSKDEVNERPYGWSVSYNQRALLVRMVCQNKKCRILRDLEAVKFITSDPNSHQGTGFLCDMGPLYTILDDFYADLDTYVKTFEHSDIVSEHWKEILSCMELFDLKYGKLEVSGWTSATNKKLTTEKFGKLSKGAQKYLSAFESAMKSNMRNGEGKHWLSKLIGTFEICIDDLDIDYIVPSVDCGTNTVMEVISGRDFDSFNMQTLYNAPYSASLLRSSSCPSSSSSSSSLSSPSSSLQSPSVYEETSDEISDSRHTVVPDFCIMLGDYPGMFPLVIKLKPANMELEGVNQNLKQMLSKLFFQDIVFGILITPTLYHLSFIVKKQGKLHSARIFGSLITMIDGVKTFDVGKFNIMCTFIYHVLKWSNKTKCLL